MKKTGIPFFILMLCLAAAGRLGEALSRTLGYVSDFAGYHEDSRSKISLWPLN